MFEDFFETRVSRPHNECVENETDVVHQSGHVMDATSQNDGRMVCIKRLTNDSPELEIATFFSQPHLRSDPRNHCVPVLDSFRDEIDQTISYMVMPFLRRMDNPPFETVGDVVDFADQVIEVRRLPLLCSTF